MEIAVKSGQNRGVVIGKSRLEPPAALLRPGAVSGTPRRKVASPGFALSAEAVQAPGAGHTGRSDPERGA